MPRMQTQVRCAPSLLQPGEPAEAVAHARRFRTIPLPRAGALFAVTRVTAPGDAPISRWQFQTTFPYYSSHATPAIVGAAVGRFGGGKPAVWRPVAAFLRSYQLDGGYTPGPVLVLFALTGLAGSAFVLRRRGRAVPAGRDLALACLLFFGTAVTVTLVSDLFVFSWRYQLPALVTLAPAGALGISVLTGWFETRRRGAH